MKSGLDAKPLFLQVDMLMHIAWIELSMKSVKILGYCIWHYVYIITACSFMGEMNFPSDLMLVHTLNPTLIISMLKPNLNYYLSFDVCVSVCVCLSASANFLMVAYIKEC